MASVWPNAYRIELVDSVEGGDARTGIRFDHKFFIPRKQEAKRKEVLRVWYKDKAPEKIKPRVDRHARELGVDFTECRFVDNRYRWGSCTVRLTAKTASVPTGFLYRCAQMLPSNLLRFHRPTLVRVFCLSRREAASVWLNKPNPVDETGATSGVGDRRA